MQWLNKNQMPGLESHLKIGTVWCVYLSCSIYEFQVAIRGCTSTVDVTTDLKWKPALSNVLYKQGILSKSCHAALKMAIIS